MTSATAAFTLFYAIFSAGFLLQSKEFIGAGLTPENVLSRWLQNTNNEDVQFIQHHIVRTTGTLILHCCLPLIYLFGYSYFSLIVDGDYKTVEHLMNNVPMFYYAIASAVLLVVSYLSVKVLEFLLTSLFLILRSVPRAYRTTGIWTAGKITLILRDFKLTPSTIAGTMLLPISTMSFGGWTSLSSRRVL